EPATFAPVGVLPLIVTDEGPLNDGSVFSTEASASARPNPNVLFGSPLPRRTALFSTRLRRLVRADVGLSAPSVEASRHGADCSTSAGGPAACGAAADVPKNGAGNPPAPLTATPSMLEISGLVRPS